MNFLKSIAPIFRSNLIQNQNRNIFTIQNLVTKTIAPSSCSGIASSISAASNTLSTSFTTTLHNSTLLKPISFIYNQIAGFKVKGVLKRRCKDCYFVMRQQRLYVLCKTHPRHKQMSMVKKPKNTWILTHATQSKIRPY